MSHDVEPGATFFEGTCQFILYLYSHTLTFSESSRFSVQQIHLLADSYIGSAKGTTFLDSSLSSPLQPSDQEIKWSISTCLGRHERPGHYGRCGWQHTSNWGRLLGSRDSTTSPGDMRKNVAIQKRFPRESWELPVLFHAFSVVRSSRPKRDGWWLSSWHRWGCSLFTAYCFGFEVSPIWVMFPKIMGFSPQNHPFVHRGWNH